MTIRNTLLSLALAGTAILSGCNGGGGGGGSTTYGYYNSPYITVSGFVNALNTHDANYFDSYLVLDTYQTDRTYQPGEDDWFVIWDEEYGRYMAVSLQYVRSITYYSYYSSNFQTADEFRNIQYDDVVINGYSGDRYGYFGGENYEFVSQDPYSGYYVGDESGMLYENEVETTDVALMASDEEMRELAKKMSYVSYTYQVSMPMALSIVSLGQKAEGMLKRGASNQELTDEDQAVLFKDLEHLTGKSIEDMLVGSTTEEGRERIFNEIASHNEGTGMTAEKLENKILPELFGME